MNWSQSDLEKMDEKQWRMYLSLRFDSIEDKLTDTRDSYVSKACFWKMVAGGACAIVLLAIKSFFGSKG